MPEPQDYLARGHAQGHGPKTLDEQRADLFTPNPLYEKLLAMPEAERDLWLRSQIPHWDQVALLAPVVEGAQA